MGLRAYPSDHDHMPLGQIGRVPIHAATILAMLYCAGMFITTLLDSAHAHVPYLVFSTEDFYLHGRLWEVLTCTFVNGPSFFFLFGVFFYYRFGADIEQFIGRSSFLKFYALTILTPALVLGAWRLAGQEGAFAGMNEITVGIFIGYATLYPNMEYLGWVPLKYIAFACLAIASLGYFPNNNWPGLSVLLAECGVAYGFIGYVKRGGSVEFRDLARRLNPFRRRPKFRVLPTTGTPPRSPGTASVESVDAILDKISRSGFASLTQGERDQLEKAREALMKKRH